MKMAIQECRHVSLLCDQAYGQLSFAFHPTQSLGGKSTKILLGPFLTREIDEYKSKMCVPYWTTYIFVCLIVAKSVWSFLVLVLYSG